MVFPHPNDAFCPHFVSFIRSFCVQFLEWTQSEGRAKAERRHGGSAVCYKYNGTQKDINIYLNQIASEVLHALF